MSSTPLFFRILNPIMKSILKSPFHKMVSGQIMIISFKGAKSGKAYATPVSYSRDGDTVYAFTHSNWWKNFRNGADVRIRLQGKDYAGYATAISNNPDRIIDPLYKHIQAVPNDARYYNVTLDKNGQPNMEQVKQAAAEAIMIEIAL